MSVKDKHRVKRKDLEDTVRSYRVRDSLDVVVTLGCQLLAELTAPQWEGYQALLSRDYARFLSVCERDLRDLTADSSLSPDDFEDAYQAVNLLRKYPFPLEGVDRGEAAIQKWWQAEEQCRLSNAVFTAISQDGAGGIEDSVFSPLHPSVYPIIRRAKRKIEKWLGPFCVETWARNCRFGDGATTSCRGSELSIGDKLWSSLEYQGNGDILGKLIEGFPRWRCDEAERALVQCPGSLVLTVPKTALTDRVICIEPTLNGFAQLGIGAMLREALRNVGCDLTDQGINQRLASRAVTKGLATLDLSSASDTIARDLVRWLLPADWVFAMESCRCSHTLLKGRRVELEKFSSMGNGYTFELESLIFLALVRSSADEVGVRLHMQRDTHVYGDDIICPTAVVPELTNVLHFCGFTLNERKSFSRGEFRESCGADVYKGRLVTPLYIKEPLENSYDVVILANRLYHRAASDRPGTSRSSRSACDLVDVADKRYLTAYRGLVKVLPPSIRENVVGPWVRGSITPWIPSSFESANPIIHRESREWSPVVNGVRHLLVDGSKYEVLYKHFEVIRQPVRTYPLERWGDAMSILLYRIRDTTSGYREDGRPKLFRLRRTLAECVTWVKSAEVDASQYPRGREVVAGVRNHASRWVNPPAFV
ncbi:TPA_asm: RNA-directed RNA polymerase [ssRNA phage SRR5466365_3]|uniref:RNA-directed RNA polymerase n=1 Tax=ssRNA phage SRR5466365_3 TaxID=2786402 RepID=A0A8S5L4M4_9VIRU|nr:RNA-directed RNA polymerase [ssRNA phage SRR5466365_3]DAD52380.1 TPA_asm: RNA-directed RNA polymerase [ssRNA phage SRR5466365_3]